MGSRLAAMGLFVLGQSALATLSLGVAVLPALATFLVASLLIVRAP